MTESTAKRATTLIILLVGLVIIAVFASSRSTIVRDMAPKETESLPLETEEIKETSEVPEEPQGKEDMPLEEEEIVPDLFSAFGFAVGGINVGVSARDAAVNILCTSETRRSTSTITGSGVLVDPRGVILTNAHVAQYFLLDNTFECIIRQGAPAIPLYKATILYLPPAWIEENAGFITQKTPEGRGENDYAFLLIEKTIDRRDELPDAFPSVGMDQLSGTGDGTGVLQAGMRMNVVSYPAEFFANEIIIDNLFPLSTVATIGELFTFEEQTLDLFSLGGSILAQRGSSGGAVVGDDGKLKGLVVTSTKAEALSERDLRAITIGHINRSLSKLSNTNLNTLLSGNLGDKANAFDNNTAPGLKELLVNELEK